MSVLVKCSTCPATIADKDAALEGDWVRCSESGEWTCECCCHAEYLRHVHLRPLVRAYNSAIRDGDYDAAELIKRGAL